MANQDFSLTDQIIWDRLIAIVEDQAQTLVRTAFSTTVREAGDLSAGLFDNKGRMLAQAITGTPGHVNAMAASVKNFLEKFEITSLKGGDALLTNDPWHGTGHLNDFTVVTPVFYQEAPIGLFAATSHIADIGGLGFGADGKQVYEEGINLPIDFLFKRKNLTKNFFLNKSINKKMFFYDIYWNDMRIWGTTALILVHLSRLIRNIAFNNV